MESELGQQPMDAMLRERWVEREEQENPVRLLSRLQPYEDAGERPLAHNLPPSRWMRVPRLRIAVPALFATRCSNRRIARAASAVVQVVDIRLRSRTETNRFTDRLPTPEESQSITSTGAYVHGG